MLQLEPYTQAPIFTRIPIHHPETRKKIEHYSFSLNDKIGKGFSSTVYRGKNDETNETVAIKVIELKSLKDQVTKNLLQTELECIKKIDHANVLKYIDSYETVNNCYIITEFCEGGDLEKYLKIKNKLTEKEVANIFHQFYSAYLKFHSSGFIHRDIKPANIFLKNNQIKLADFGMVKKLSENPKDTYNVGTPVYMPPESLTLNVYSEKSDIWSMGVMLYQLTHGYLPWKGLNEQELKNNIQNSKVVYDMGIVSMDFVMFVERCLDKNMNSRIGITEMAGLAWMRKVVYVGENSRNDAKRAESMGKNLVQRNNVFLCTPSVSNLYARSNSVSNHPCTTTLPTVPSIQLQPSSPSPLAEQKSTERQLTQQPIKEPIKEAPIKKDCQPAPAPKSPLDFLVCTLHYLRYISKIYKFLCSNTMILIPITITIKLKAMLMGELMRCLSMQENMVDSKQNIFGVKGWMGFVEGSKWATFEAVVKQYSKKYRKMYSHWLSSEEQNENKSPPSTIPKLLSPTINTIYFLAFSNIESSNSSTYPHIPEHIELLNYLVDLQSMCELIEEKGWIVFCNKSQIAELVEIGLKVNDNNWRDVWEEVKGKLGL